MNFLGKSISKYFWNATSCIEELIEKTSWNIQLFWDISNSWVRNTEISQQVFHPTASCELKIYECWNMAMKQASFGSSIVFHPYGGWGSLASWVRTVYGLLKFSYPIKSRWAALFRHPVESLEGRQRHNRLATWPGIILPPSWTTLVSRLEIRGSEIFLKYSRGSEILTKVEI